MFNRNQTFIDKQQKGGETTYNGTFIDFRIRFDPFLCDLEQILPFFELSFSFYTVILG